MKINYDFFSDYTLTAVAQVCEESNVAPLSVTFNPTEYDNVTVEFRSHRDAIQFTATYLDSDDVSDIAEYVPTTLNV
jgi:hypothetical protein